MGRKPMEGTIEREIYDLCNAENYQPPDSPSQLRSALLGVLFVVGSTLLTFVFVRWMQG